LSPLSTKITAFSSISLWLTWSHVVDGRMDIFQEMKKHW
jgi:hypothetical protein